jgi:DNA-directed RNA polymerase specialized sigma24 family protein
MSTMPSSASAPTGKNPLGDPEVRRFLEEFVRRRVPPSDVDDVVQTVLVDALAAERVPGEREELRKWLVGVARHKVADFHRKSGRERPTEPPEQEAPPAPLESRSMVEWAEEQAGRTKDGKKTLEWMAREGEGDKLEHIAADEDLPPARVRQRVSRMRRWMKERWLAELAAVAALAILAFVLYRLMRREPEEAILPDKPTGAPVEPSPVERARSLRADALERCDKGEWRPCLDGLDEAKRLDPAGDADPAVQAARARANDALPEDSKSPVPPDSKVVPPESKEPPDTKEQKVAPPPTTTPAPVKGPKSKVDDKKLLEDKLLEEKKRNASVEKTTPPPAPTDLPQNSVEPPAPTTTAPAPQPQAPPQMAPQQQSKKPMPTKGKPSSFDSTGSLGGKK